MRKTLFVLLAAVAIGACNEQSTAPATDTLLLDDAALLAFSAMDMADPGSHFIARLNSLPDSIRLSSEQRTQIRALVEAFVQATRADIEALNAIHQEARAARQAGKTEAEIRAIFAKGDAIRTRLHAAEAKLRSDIEAVLTPAQKSWLTSGGQRPPVCRTQDLQLTDAQKTQITALVSAFEVSNRADLEAIKAVHEEARAAQQAGASRERIAEILAKAEAPMRRVRAAHEALNTAVRALLTPAQLASGCFGRP
jgi:Spy/CpxP family protein refolding chaperone